MARSEVRILVHDFSRRFTNYDQTHDHGLLCSSVLQKIVFTQPLDKRHSISGRLPYVLEIIP